jgi:hypothetical protein
MIELDLTHASSIQGLVEAWPALKQAALPGWYLDNVEPTREVTASHGEQNTTSLQ